MNSGPKFDFFGFGLGLGYIMVCEITLVCAQARSVIIIKELARDAARKVSLKKYIFVILCLYHNHLPRKKSRLMHCAEAETKSRLLIHHDG